MGQNQSINKLNFESVQNIINKNTTQQFVIISTLENNNQDCLIKNTISPEKEIELLNFYLKENKKINILIYGENCSDNKVVYKYNQLYQLGFTNLYIYIGGLFEWLLLQDIYGNDEFPTSNNILDILKYKGKQII
jgi:hypothetical protein